MFAYNARIKLNMRKQKHSDFFPSVAPELNLHALTVDEALLKLDEFLNDAYVSGLYQVKIVHGKGTGTLRQAVRRRLSGHTLVESFRPGGYGEGGIGVTVVELARK